MNLLGKISAEKRFRDPIYGYVWLTKAEVKIVDTLVFQRLRRIQQLALTKYVYPTAEHSRFVHSLGVLQCATNIFNELLRKNHSYFEHTIGDPSDIIDFVKTLRFAALLHDVGHLPFSHACEEALLPKGVNHESVSQFIIINHPMISKYIREEGADPAIVASLLGDKYLAKYSMAKRIISGVFDADRADYLLRDSYNCGVNYGNYDYIRYVSSLNIIPIEGQPFSLAIQEGDIPLLESFLLARFHYNMQIPYHRTRTGLDRVLQVYVRYLALEGRLPDINIVQGSQKIESMDLDRFKFFDDMDLFQEIKKDYVKGLKWAKILLREEHLHPVWDVSKVDTSVASHKFLDSC